MDAAEQSLVQAAEIDPRYFAQLAQFYERQGKWEDSAAVYEEAIGNSQKPSRDLQIRYAAALINTDGGAVKARTVPVELAKASPERHARPLHAVDGRALGGRRQGGGGDGAQDHVDPSDQRLRPAGPRRGARRAIRIQADRRVVTPLVKEPSRAKGREEEGAAVLVQLGMAQQQLANWDGSIAAFTAAKSLTPEDRRSTPI